MDFQHSAQTLDYQKRIRKFIKEHIEPIEHQYYLEIIAKKNAGDWKNWEVPAELEALKQKAKAEGLWNLFLPDSGLAAGLNNVDYAPLAEEMGRSFIAPVVFNCNAPDTGNMEVLWKYGTDEQKEQWLKPLMDGTIRSAFCMTEPDVASSDATNMEATAVIDGDEIVLNGKKWFATGIGHPECKTLIVMALTDENADRHHRHSMVLVPMDTAGVDLQRMLPVFGEYDEPFGHGEVHFNDVRVPVSNFIVGPGKGFEIAQGRLGPGRIHHCMRCIGAAEMALKLMIERGMQRVAFGKPIIHLGGNREKIADFRMAIDQARLLTLSAAWKIDKVGALAALTEISAIKVIAPNVLQQVIDEAIQMFGAAGVSHDTPLATMYAYARTLRIADGPDAVHRGMVARLELAKYRHLAKK
ncbi:MAG: acyl-CoA dehydrogenase family protein [Gammaproteobacteria bacterium]|nr:acyl-CoA dehydrogenase family protein [Gammaproteobacteria bacterium]